MAGMEALSAMTYHVRATDRLGVWELSELRVNGLTVRGSVKDMWKLAQEMARKSGGEAHIYYRNRDAVRLSVDHRAA